MQIEFVSLSPSCDLEEDGTSGEVPETVTDLTGNASYGQYFQKWLRDELVRSWWVGGVGLGGEIISCKLSDKIKAKSKLYLKKPNDRALNWSLSEAKIHLQAAWPSVPVSTACIALA